jgi:hypothetical protein
MNVVKIIEINNMLTIENFHKKIIGRGPNSKKWFCGGVEETETQYWIYPTTSDGKPLNRINIERTPVGPKDEYEYELWWWHNDEDPAHQVPIRKMLSIYDFRVGAGALIELIDYMLKLK